MAGIGEPVKPPACSWPAAGSLILTALVSLLKSLLSGSSFGYSSALDLSASLTAARIILLCACADLAGNEWLNPLDCVPRHFKE